MKNRLAIGSLALLAGLTCLQAQDKKEAVPDPTRVTVAVLNFDGTLPGNQNVGADLSEILTAKLSMEDTFDLVERTKIQQILDEHKLKLVGIVDQEKSAKIGKLTGAKLLIMGKIFSGLSNQVMITAKVVSVETGVLKGTLRTVDLKDSLSGAALLLADDIAALIRKNLSILLPGDNLEDPTLELHKILATKKLPSVAVIIPENHVARRAPQNELDPAVETEIKKILTGANITVMDTGKNDLADWARKMGKGEKPPWPGSLEKVDYVVIGEGFSEFATRIGDLTSCAARIEINVIERKSGKIVVADRCTDRGIDMVENIAGKTALQNGGKKLAVRLLQYFAKTLPDKKQK